MFEKQVICVEKCLFFEHARRLTDLKHTSVCVCGSECEVFNLNMHVCVYVCTETRCGSLPGLRAWLRECLKPVYSGCVVEESGGGTWTS